MFVKAYIYIDCRLSDILDLAFNADTRGIEAYNLLMDAINAKKPWLFEPEFGCMLFFSERIPRFSEVDYLKFHEVSSAFEDNFILFFKTEGAGMVQCA